MISISSTRVQFFPRGCCPRSNMQLLSVVLSLACCVVAVPALPLDTKIPTPRGNALPQTSSIGNVESFDLDSIGLPEKPGPIKGSQPSAVNVSIAVFPSESSPIQYCELCPCVNNTMYCSALHLRSFLLKKEHVQITYLELSHNQLEDLPASVFSMMPNLREASLSDNYISTVDSKAFEGVYNLKLLDLSSNAIVNMPSETFAKHSRLQRIYLLRNRLSDVTYIAQIRNCSLETFQISANQLSLLPMNAFGGCDGMKELWIDGNKISQIHENAFLGLARLTTLDLSDNRILEIHEKTFSSLKSLRVLDLSRNRLTLLEGSVFLALSSLENLNLSYNWLFQILSKTFSSCTSLRRLDLSENLIERIESSAFTTSANNSKHQPKKPLHSKCANLSNTTPNIPLEYLDLSHNHLRYVPVSSMLAFTSMEQLNLESNLFTAVGTDFVCLAAHLNHRLRFSGNRLVCTCQTLYPAFHLAERIAPDFQPECLHTEEPWVVIRGRKCVMPPSSRFSFSSDPGAGDGIAAGDDDVRDEPTSVNVRASVLGGILGLAFVVSLAAFGAEVVKYYRRAKYEVPGPEEIRMTQYARRESVRSGELARPEAALQDTMAVVEPQQPLPNEIEEMSKL